MADSFGLKIGIEGENGRPFLPKQKAQVENAGQDELRKRMADMSALLWDQPTAIRFPSAPSKGLSSPE